MQIKLDRNTLKQDKSWGYYFNSEDSYKRKLMRLSKFYLGGVNFKKMIERIIDTAYSQTFEENDEDI